LGQPKKQVAADCRQLRQEGMQEEEWNKRRMRDTAKELKELAISG